MHFYIELLHKADSISVHKLKMCTSMMFDKINKVFTRNPVVLKNAEIIQQFVKNLENDTMLFVDYWCAP